MNTFSMIENVTIANPLKFRFLHDPPALPCPALLLCRSFWCDLTLGKTISLGSFWEFWDNPSLAFTSSSQDHWQVHCFPPAQTLAMGLQSELPMNRPTTGGLCVLAHRSRLPLAHLSLSSRWESECSAAVPRAGCSDWQKSKTKDVRWWLPTSALLQRTQSWCL